MDDPSLQVLRGARAASIGGPDPFAHLSCDDSSSGWVLWEPWAPGGFMACTQPMEGGPKSLNSCLKGAAAPGTEPDSDGTLPVGTGVPGPGVLEPGVLLGAGVMGL